MSNPVSNPAMKQSEMVFIGKIPYVDLIRNEFMINVFDLGSDIFPVIKQGIHQIKVVVISAQLADIDGLLLTRQLLEICPALKIILVSDKPDPAYAVNALKEGAYDFLAHPFELNSFKYHLNLARQAFSVEFLAASDQKCISESINYELFAATEGLAEMELFQYFESNFVETSDVFSAVISHPGAQPVDRFSIYQSFVQYISRYSIAAQKKVMFNCQEKDVKNYMAYLSLEFQTFSLSYNHDVFNAVCAEKPDVLVTEITPDSLFQYDVIKQLKCGSDTIIVIVIVDFNDIDCAVNALRYGAVDYLNKPVLKDDLLSCIKKNIKKESYDKYFYNFSKTFIQSHLVSQSRRVVLEKLAFNRHLEGKSMTLNEVRLFFPELTAIDVYDGGYVSFSVLKQSLDQQFAI